MESSDDELGLLEDDPCIDTGRFQERYLLHELVFACSNPPAAAATIPLRHPDSSRLVGLKNIGPERSGSPASCRERVRA